MLKSIILAAGEGKRMKSDTAKVLHKVCGKAIIDYVCDAVKGAGSEEQIVVVGNRSEQVVSHFGETVKFAMQEDRLGTAHAVMQAEQYLKEYDGDVIVIYGDTPLIQAETLKDAYKTFQESGCTGLVITADLLDPFGYGRIVKDRDGSCQRIVEEKDATPAEQKISEINSGMYIFKARELFKTVFKVKNDNAQNEYYLTDVIEIMAREGKKVFTYTIENEDEILGINDRIQLSDANRIMNERNVYQAMLNGVTVIDPDSTYIDSLSQIEYDTVLYPNCYINNSKVGKGCVLGPDTSLDNMTVLSNVTIKKSTCMDSTVKNGTTVGPYAYIRPNSEIGENVKIGDFVEVKKSVIGNGTKVSHLTYIGDSEVGERVNFGCGTVTVNYDGKNKFKTLIGDDVFIGCNTNLVAPVKVGNKAFIAAGSTITDNIPDKNFAIARERQINKEGWKKKEVKNI